MSETRNRSISAPNGTLYGASLVTQWLQPPTLSHLTEAPELAAILMRVINECVRARRRFPHTLLVGPSDSGKRGIARAIAAEMAVPIVCHDLANISGWRQLDSIFQHAGSGTILLLSNLDHAQWAMPHIARSLAGCHMESPYADFMAAINGESWKGNQESDGYEDFTLVVTKRTPPDDWNRLYESMERTFYTKRNAITEACRVSRALHRGNVIGDADALQLLAERTVTEQWRTTEAAVAVLEWAHEHGLSALGKPEMAQAIVDAMSCSIASETAKKRRRQRSGFSGGMFGFSIDLDPDDADDSGAITAAKAKAKAERQQVILVACIAATVIFVAILAAMRANDWVRNWGSEPKAAVLVEPLSPAG